MLMTEVGCEFEAEYSHNFTPEASQLSAEPFSSFLSQQKLSQWNKTTHWKSKSV